jgi:hypothetical protein
VRLRSVRAPEAVAPTLRVLPAPAAEASPTPSIGLSAVEVPRRWTEAAASCVFGLLRPAVAAAVWGAVVLGPAQARLATPSGPAASPVPAQPARVGADRASALHAQPVMSQSTGTSCGLASMAMIINSVARGDERRLPVSERQVRAKALELEVLDSATGRLIGPAYGDAESGGPRGFLLDAAPAVLRAFGVESFLAPAPQVVTVGTTSGSGSRWTHVDFAAQHIQTLTAEGTRPAMVAFKGVSDPANTVHFVVIDGLDATGRVLVRDPNGGRRLRLTLDEFNRALSPRRGQPIVVLGSPPEGYAPLHQTRPR